MDAVNSQRGIVSAQLLCQLAQEEGMELSAVLQGSGISIATLGNAHSRILGHQELQIMQNITEHVSDLTGLGIRLGQRYGLANYGVFGFGLSSCATLFQAAEFGLRFVGLTYAFSHFDVHFGVETVQVKFHTKGLPKALRPLVVERDLSALVSVVHEITDTQQACKSVYFKHGEGMGGERHQEFFGVAPQFGASFNMVEFNLALFALPLPHANAKNNEDCTQECEMLLAELQQRSGWPDKVRHVLEGSKNLNLTMEAIADKLFVTSRTLRRHLTAQGTSFRELLDDMRKRKAKELLASRTYSIKEVAQKVGYEEPASFVHAFKRWTNTTPSRWRDEQ